MRSFLILAAICGLSISCRSPLSKGVKADRKLVRYLPADMTMLAGVDLQALRSSRLYKRHAGEFDFGQSEKARAQWGIDPQKDISEALVSWANAQPEIVAKGEFENLKPRDGLKLVQPDILAAGSSAYVDHLPTDGLISQGLRSRMEQLPKEDQIWIVSNQGLPMSGMPLSANVASALANISDNIREFSIGIGVDDGAHLRGELTCDSEAGAKRVHDALRGLIGMARLMTRDDQMSRLKLYDALQVDQDHALVHVHADLNAGEADSAIALGFSSKEKLSAPVN